MHLFFSVASTLFFVLHLFSNDLFIFLCFRHYFTVLIIISLIAKISLGNYLIFAVYSKYCAQLYCYKQFRKYPVQRPSVRLGIGQMFHGDKQVKS